jgi:hypothetical protein
LCASSAAAADPPDWNDPPVPVLLDQLPGLADAAVRLPLAALLGAALAFRPRRRGAPPRQAPVIETQILLAIVGCLVMLIVGQSLARAFGIVGVASLVRYRAKVKDPKEAGVMLANLGVGLACGVGLLSARRVRRRVPDRLPLVGRVARAEAAQALPPRRHRAGADELRGRLGRCSSASAPRSTCVDLGERDLVRRPAAPRYGHGRPRHRDHVARGAQQDRRRMGREEGS